MEITGCPDPDCALPAEVVDRWHFASTDGPVEHVRTRCVNGHGFTVPVEVESLEDGLRRLCEQAARLPAAARPRRTDPTT